MIVIGDADSFTETEPDYTIEYHSTDDNLSDVNRQDAVWYEAEVDDEVIDILTDARVTGEVEISHETGQEHFPSVTPVGSEQIVFVDSSNDQVFTYRVDKPHMTPLGAALLISSPIFVTIAGVILLFYKDFIRETIR